MPAFSEYSTNPDSNSTIGGVNVAEDCSPGGINNAIRQLAADGRELYDLTGALPSTKMDKAGGAFTGQITRNSRGGYLHFASTAFTDGQVYIVPEGTARPAAAEGVMIFYYS